MARKRTYTRHGLGGVKAVVSVRGLEGLDQRTAPVRAVLEKLRAMPAAPETAIRFLNLW